MGRESLDSSEAEGPGRETDDGRPTTDKTSDDQRLTDDDNDRQPTTDNKTTDGNDQPDDGRQDDGRPTATPNNRRPNRRPTTRRVKNKHNPRTSIPSGGYRAIGPTGGITVSERRHTSPEVGHGEGVKASGVHPKRGRAVRKRFVLFCLFLFDVHSPTHRRSTCSVQTASKEGSHPPAIPAK